MSSIGDRLKAMGGSPQSKPNEINPSKTQTRFPIESVVSGNEISTIFGATFSVSSEFDQEYQHGELVLKDIPALDMIAEWSKISPGNSLDPHEIVFLDTETTGLSGGTGTYAFLVGLGYHTPLGFRVDQLFMRDPTEEPALLAALDQWLTSYKTIVTFNGKSFDIPLINTRFTMNAIATPTTGKSHVDLLHLARRLWRDRLVSRALGDLEKEIVGFYRQADEVPGYLIPQYYFDYLRTADARPMRGVLYHNMIDIVTLAALFNFTAKILANPAQVNLPSLDQAAIARLYEELGHLEEAAEMYETCITQGLPEEQFFKTIERFASMRRKQGRMDLAAALWQHAAERENITALIELAKLYEHVVGDEQQAALYTSQAARLVSLQPMPSYKRKILKAEILHRQERLAKKISKKKDQP